MAQAQTSKRSAQDKSLSGVILSSKKRVGCTIWVITPDEARTILDRFNFENQRARKSFDVHRIATGIERDEFALCTIVFYVWNGRLFLVDGQHRLEACIVANVPVELVVAYKFVDSYTEVQTAYATYDCHKPRTKKNRIDAVCMPSDTGLKSSQCGKLMTAVQFIENEFRGESIRARTAISANFHYMKEKSLEWRDEGLAYYNAIWNCPKGRLTRWSRGAVFAVALVALRYQPEKAYTFFETAANDYNLEEGTPEFALAKVIRECDSERMGTDRLARLVAACWNAYYDGRQITTPARGVPQDLSSAPPIVIKGTPFNGE